MPNDVASNDFLQRFLARSGPGAHHLTFKVPDLEQALATATEAGYRPIGIDVSDPEWMEAFIHPHQATGIVVQMAEAGEEWTSPAPDDFPATHRRRHEDGEPVSPASLLWVVHAVASLDEARALFVGVLGGQVVAQGPDGFGHLTVDVSWGGPLSLRLVAPPEPAGHGSGYLHDWLGGRTGRLHHLELAVEEPEGLPGSRPLAATSPVGWRRTDGVPFREIPPEENAGLRLIMAPD
jgi:catechol 2,3-dioxygenase-like lactoylglutathione lyase family enzyme